MSQQFRNGAAFLLRYWVGLPHQAINDIIEDCVQVAWCRYLEKPMDDLFKCGKFAAQEYIRKNGKFYSSTRQIDETDHEWTPTTSRDPIDMEISEELVAEFYHQRRPSGPEDGRADRTGGQRRLDAAYRDALIADLIHQGYSDDGIALETGFTYWTVRKYRQQIKRRLAAMLAAKQKNTESSYCPAWD